MGVAALATYVGVAACRVPSGELLEVVVKENNLTEAVAVNYLSQLLMAVDTLHKLKVAHLDIRVSHIASSRLE